MRPSARVRVCAGFGALVAAVVAISGVGGAGAGSAPLGQRLLVKTEGTFGTNVTVVDERGRVRAHLGLELGLNGGIAVSPGGTRIAYVRALPRDVPYEAPRALRRALARLPQSTLEFDSFLFSTQVGGSSSYLEALTPLAATGRPAWHPGGRAVVVSRARARGVHLFTTTAAAAGFGGTGTSFQVTAGPGRDLNPCWSPDGRMIVFEHRRRGETDLYTVRPDGSGLRLLVGWPGQETAPDFSPDGRRLVFSSNLSGRFQLYVMPAGGGPARRLTQSFGNDTRPAWSPDGRWIAFSSDRDDDNDVFLVDPTGQRQRKLTDNSSEDLVEDWQPLRDARAPIVRALSSQSARGGPARVRFAVRDASPRVRVAVDLEFTYRTPQGPGQIGTGDVKLVATGTPAVKVLAIPIDDDFSLGEPTVELPSRGRFCLVAVDPWGNVSRESCAAFRFT